MKNIFYGLSVVMVLTGITFFSFFSCFEETSPRNTEYPDQLIYMPAAVSGEGQFVIDDISRGRGQLPYEGNPYRYVVDISKREFRVPLSVYRSGINNKGAFTVNINVNTDAVAQINEGRTNPYLLIPSDKYSIVNSVEMKDGEELAQFDLIVNLDLLRDNFPSAIFALGVEISSSKREVSPELSTTVVIINTRMVKPTANFTYSAPTRNVEFENTSTMSEKYEWNFGDGSAVSTSTSPSHTYAAGTYTVTLTAWGVTGDEDKSIKSVVITVE